MGFGSEKQPDVLLGELRGGKGTTQEGSRCARLSEHLSCLHKIHLFISSNKHTPNTHYT